MWIFVVIIAVVIISLIYELRIRKPDQLILRESSGKITLYKGRFYPRHFSLVLPKTIHSLQVNIEASAKGSLDIRMNVSIAVHLSLDNVQALITSGGWNTNAVQKAAGEVETFIHSLIREYTEKYEIAELSWEKVYGFISSKMDITKEKYGLEVLSVTLQSFEIVDSKIAEAVRQQESARIFEQTELINQQARISAAKARLQADEEIARLENEMNLKKYELRKSELEKESQIAEKRVTDELKRKKMQLEYDKEELELLKNNPELLVLTPQAARLAEASQSLKNAKTVISVSPNEIANSGDLLGLFQSFLQGLVVNNPRLKQDNNNNH